MGARMIEINAGDKLLKDYKERTSNRSHMQVPASQTTRPAPKGPASPTANQNAPADLLMDDGSIQVISQSEDTRDSRIGERRKDQQSFLNRRKLSYQDNANRNVTFKRS